MTESKEEKNRETLNKLAIELTNKEEIVVLG